MKVRLPGSGGPGNMQQLLKQAQKMQEDMAQKQAELEEREYTASAGSDMVKATVNGKHELLKLDISEELIEDAKDDKEMLEDLIITAINTAVKQATENSDEEMSKITAHSSTTLTEIPTYRTICIS